MNARLIINNCKMQKYLYKDLYLLEDNHWWHKAKRDLVSYFLKKYLTSRNCKILDIGCGTGKNLETFSKFGTTWGIDNSNDAIRFCKKRGLQNISKGDAEKLPFKKNFFDSVTALDVLEHVDDSKSLKTIYRVLKSEGIVIATVPAFPILWSKWDEVLHHKRRYTSSTLIKTFKESGFEIIKVSYIYSFLFFPTLIIRSLKNIFYKNYYPSDFKLSNILINNIMGKLAKSERNFLIKHNIPFGTSLIIIAKKNETK